MQEIEKYKRKRATIRTSVTKLMSKIEVLLKEVNEVNLDLLLEIADQLEEKEKSLKSLNSEIETLVTDPKLYDSEIIESEEYADKIITAKSKIKAYIKKGQNAEYKAPVVVNENMNQEARGAASSIKLPKLSIPKFYGDSSLWLEFYNIFESSINMNQSLTKVEKFSYLKTLLGGEAYNVVKGFPMNEESYDLCIQLLKERFGKTETIINSHMNKLLSIEPIKHSSNIKGLKRLYDECEINIRSLKSLGVTSGSYGHLLNPILLRILPQDFVLEYYRKRDPKKDSDVSELVEFLKSEIECREAMLLVGNQRYNSDKNVSNKNYGRSATALATSVKPFCMFCKSLDHPPNKCSVLSDEEKRLKLKREGRCYKCFLKSHLSSQCRSKIQPCGNCQSKNHITLFCFKKENLNVPQLKSESETIVSTSQCNNVPEKRESILLQTCCVIAQSGSKSKITRILLDSGSERSFATNSLIQELKLPLIRKERLTVYSFGMSHGKSSEFEVYKIRLKSRCYPQKIVWIEVLATDLISAISLPPANSQNIREFMRDKGLAFADCADESPSINILVGSDYLGQIQRGNMKRIDDYLFATSTVFGYTVMGRVHSEKPPVLNTLCVSAKECFDLQSFWKLESIGIYEDKNELSQNDLETMKYFNENLKFVNGKYETKLLWKENKNELKGNFNVARQRLLGLENKLSKNKWLSGKYDEIIKEQCERGIIEKCEFSENDNTYYMPHRPVVRTDKSTTKVRIVYDASAKDKDTKSLNDILDAGPNLNPNILDVILKFRVHKIAFSADIEKAFLQIGIAEEDRDYLRFLYYNDCDRNKGLAAYRMTRVTFGVTCSPFILIATIKHHIEKYRETHKHTVDILNTSLYMDDLFSGSNSIEQAFKLSSEAVAILKDAGMNLRKFKSNCLELKSLWQNHSINCEEEDSYDRSPLKVLGIIWDTNRDVFKLSVQPLLGETGNSTITKRYVLQVAAKIYDPVGFISPFVFRIKCLMQKLWQTGINWDEELTDELKSEFKQWYLEVKDLETLCIPRKYFLQDINMTKVNIQLIIFSDASIKGYGAVAYLRDPDTRSSSFVLAKSRVAPLKKVSLPRMELLAAVIAARMADYLKKLFLISNNNVFCYSDSQIVIYWIRGDASKWKPFIENRVREIQNIVRPGQWRYCKGTENPPDILSRECRARDLVDNDFWWQGPSWIRHELMPVSPHVSEPVIEDEVLQEQRKILICPVTNNSEFDLLNKFSSWTKLKRVMSWCLRFIHNIKFPANKISGFLKIEELDAATYTIANLVQQVEFGEEIKQIKAGKNLHSSSKILSLNPFIDSHNILRVGGRLRNANISETQKHQIILPRKHHVTDLIVNHFHVTQLHSGTELTISAIRKHFWIVNIRQVVRKIIWKCIRCFKSRANLVSQLEADLPAARVVPDRPFSKVGLDYAGPFMVRTRKGRGIKPFKCYICLYICFVTKAIHLELVSDLSTEAFLASLKRFVARRGKPQVIFSDRGTNFVGADREMKRATANISTDEKFQAYLSEERIQWNFNPPAAPHFGGLWEAGVKQMKGHLKRTVGLQILTYEEFHTLITQVESCLNSRPLIPLSSDPNDLSALTPGHFLIGTALTAIPEPELMPAKISTLERWKLIRGMFQSFWKRWSSDYLSQLQKRTKWFRSKPNLEINDLVLIKDENQPPLKWKLGRIIKLYPGADGRVRVVKVKTKLGEIKRPVAKLSLLPADK